MGFEFLEKQSDKLLAKFIAYLMEKGEMEWFETKRGLPKGEIKKIPTLLSSISNRGGGLIFYGWDEEKEIFSSIIPDQIQRIVNQQSDKCNPKINVKYHIIKKNKVLGLFVGVPALNMPVMNDERKFFLRVGSHKKEVSKNDLLESNNIKKGLKGHLYIGNFKQIFFDVVIKDFCEGIKKNISLLLGFSEKLYNEITNKWEIKFDKWLGNPPYNFPLRVNFNQWKKNAERNIQNDLIISIQKWIDELYDSLILLEEKYNVDTLKKTLKDLSYREKNKTNHRKSLTTLISQDNLWNFTDARIFIKKITDKFIIYQDEANKDLKYDIASINNLDKIIVEKIILEHNRKKCIEKTNQLLDIIFLELYKLKKTLCS